VEERDEATPASADAQLLERVRAIDAHGRGRVESARLVFEASVRDVFASDHFGVVADLRL